VCGVTSAAEEARQADSYRLDRLSFLPRTSGPPLRRAITMCSPTEPSRTLVSSQTVGTTLRKSRPGWCGSARVIWYAGKRAPVDDEERKFLRAAAHYFRGRSLLPLGWTAVQEASGCVVHGTLPAFRVNGMVSLCVGVTRLGTCYIRARTPSRVSKFG